MTEQRWAQVLRLHAPGTLSWDTLPVPAPGPGQVLVQTLLSAVSVASELSVVAGRVPVTLPCPLGYQTVGVVLASGPDTALRLGARVVTTSGHRSLSLVSADRCVPVPEGWSERAALAVVLGEETQRGIRRIVPQPAERVLIAGAGLIGLLTLFNLTRRGVHDVTVLEPEPARRALARQLGARTCAPGELARDDYDVGFECSASPAGFSELLSALRPGGRACVLSDGNWGVLTLPPAFYQRELTLMASSDGEDYAAYARWLWQHPEPLLERLFEVTVRPGELIGTFGQLTSLPRPVCVVVDWTEAAGLGVAGLGLRDGELRLAEADPAWSQAGQLEVARLRANLPVGSLLEHIGSTAVPGLPAKPVLDLAVQLPDQVSRAAAELYLPGLGYRYRDDAGAAGGRVWLRDGGGQRTHTLHLVVRGDPQWAAWLALRGRLRASAEARQAYLEAKQAALAAADRRAYTQAKSAVIARLLIDTL